MAEKATKTYGSVDEFMSADAQETAGWTPVEIDVEDGHYVVRIPRTIDKSALKVSSSGKSLVSTFRVDMGRGTLPMTIVDGDKPAAALDFRSFNFTLSFAKKAR